MTQTSRKITPTGSGLRIEHACSGDLEAFAGLYNDYQAGVFRYVYSRVNDRHLAEDITSETFIRAFKAIGRFTPGGADVGAWFVAIARNLTMDHFKSSRVRREVLVDDCTGHTAYAVAVAPSAETEVLDDLDHQPLREALAGLPDHLRSTLILQYWGGLPIKRIGDRLGHRTPGAVKSLRHRALLQLRATLEKEAVAR